MTEAWIFLVCFHQCFVGSLSLCGWGPSANHMVYLLTICFVSVTARYCARLRDVSALSVELMLDLKIETVPNKKDLLDEDTNTSAFMI